MRVIYERAGEGVDWWLRVSGKDGVVVPANKTLVATILGLEKL